METQGLLEIADEIAVEAHVDQTDKIGRPYIEHPRRVAQRVRDAGGNPEQVAAALLHDVIEDSALTADDLRARGIPDTVIGAVEALTKRDGEPYEEAVARAARHPLAALVKRCDVADNSDPQRLAEIEDVATRRRLEQKYAVGRRVLDEHIEP